MSNPQEEKPFVWLLLEKNGTGFYNFKLFGDEVESFWAWWNALKNARQKRENVK